MKTSRNFKFEIFVNQFQSRECDIIFTFYKVVNLKLLSYGFEFSALFKFKKTDIKSKNM